ncbi:magnesium chelatase subunit D family protein [Terracoccus sp. 273MFTsu3.1]|uniref:magnesium chelatase subunit D family protein n=1 Tax=Terracoccus sp. 273MFTsu3.1 TaxID=1172188 RepID=UPI00035DB96F|nr:magnesium chelatase subunit D family protein [Terracoccus sp. 273MFTsu3.1]
MRDGSNDVPNDPDQHGSPPDTFPFSAVVGSDDLALALVLTAVSPEVGGVLVRGEKGTAKSTMVRGLAAVLPRQQVVAGCRFGCAPGDGAGCPDGPHDPHAEIDTRAARLVELPIGATEDRVVGSLDLERALGRGETAYQPGLLAAANRGILYVDEVNLLHDHLVDLLLDAAAMGRNTVERDGVSVSHAARLVLVGTMNPEEGELRPQLLDRFGLTVEVAAPREPALRAEVVRRRLAFDASPVAFAARFEGDQEALRARIADARSRVGDVTLTDEMLTRIAVVCAGFEVDGLRADIVTARTAVAHAAWSGRTVVTVADVRAAARLALPHRRRRNPFDSPGIEEDLLDELLGDDEPNPEPDPENDPERDPEPDPGPGDGGEPQPKPHDGEARPSTSPETGRADGPESPRQPEPQRAELEPEADGDGGDGGDGDEGGEREVPAASAVSAADEPYRAKLLRAKGIGQGDPGRRSSALTSAGRRVGSTTARTGPVHVPATIRAAAARGATGEPSRRLRVLPGDLRRSVLQGRESNLVLLCVDASGSMAARTRMEAVKSAVLSLLLDAYQRRDKVGLVTFRGSGAELTLPPTGSVDIAARRLRDLPHGGRTPLAEGLGTAYDTLRVERLRDPNRRALLVVVTDGRATSGADALGRAARVATRLRGEGVESVVLDCESGRFRMGLAARLAEHLGAEHLPVGELAASAIVGAAHASRERAA